jgi:hypothetical protein
VTLRRASLTAAHAVCSAVSWLGGVCAGPNLGPPASLAVAVAVSVLAFAIITTGGLHWFTKPYVHALLHNAKTDVVRLQTLSFLGGSRWREFEVGEAAPTSGFHPLANLKVRCGLRWHVVCVCVCLCVCVCVVYLAAAGGGCTVRCSVISVVMWINGVTPARAAVCGCWRGGCCRQLRMQVCVEPALPSQCATPCHHPSSRLAGAHSTSTGRDLRPSTLRCWSGCSGRRRRQQRRRQKRGWGR